MEASMFLKNIRACRRYKKLDKHNCKTLKKKINFLSLICISKLKTHSPKENLEHIISRIYTWKVDLIDENIIYGHFQWSRY